jgi:aspartate-semialdehyde dehydrogenase
VQTRRPITPQRVTELLKDAPGIALEKVPSPLRAEGRDEVFVGRIRGDESAPNAFSMFVVSDNLRKGAATNAVQLAELVAERRLSPAA